MLQDLFKNRIEIKKNDRAYLFVFDVYIYRASPL